MKIYPASMILVSIVSSAPCFALVKELALCTTSEGKYTVSITDNQGTGRVRTSHIEASVSDANSDVVASYKAEEFHGIQSASFGRPKYQDTATSGKDFLLEGPSTNFRHYSLNVQMNVGRNSERISDDDLKCSVFGGTILENP